MNQNYWIFLGSGLAFIVVELFLGVSAGFDLVVIGFSLLIGAFFTWITGDITWGIVTTGVAAAIYFIFLRIRLQNSLMKTNHKMNVDKLIGQEGIVTSPIGINAPGQVKVDGEVWRAVSAKHIAIDTHITIEKVEGVTLQVRST